jgi:hypothetical protein
MENYPYEAMTERPATTIDELATKYAEGCAKMANKY